MKYLLASILTIIPFFSFEQTCNKLNHNCSNTSGLNATGVTSNSGTIYACGPGGTVLYTTSSNAYIATGDISIAQGSAATLHFKAKRASSYFSTCEVWVHVGGYCSFQVLTTPFNDNGWVQIGTFSPTTSCSTFGPFTVPSDVIGGQNLSYCIVPKNASSTNWVAIDDICVSEISGSAVPTTMNEDFGTSSSGWYPNAGYVDFPYHTYKNASDAYVLLGAGADGGVDKAAYFYTGFDFCSTVSGTGVVSREINTSAYTNGEVRLEFKSKYPCSGSNSYTFDENYQNYSPEVYIMQGADFGGNTWTQLPVNYYFSDYTWRVASYDISAYKNTNIRIKVERGGFCGTAMEAIDNFKIIDRDCSISLLSCGTISGDASPVQNTNYVYTVPAVTGANYYKWYVRDGGTLYDASPYIVSGQGTQSATINFNTLPTSGVRVLCIPFDVDPSTDADACYAKIGILSVSVSASSPLVFSSVDSTHVSCNGFNDGTITLGVSGGQSAYSYVWVPNVSTTNAATGLAPGTYQITVTDQNLDQIVESIVITEPTTLSVTLPSDFSICIGDTTTLTTTVSGGTLPYGFAWTPATNISNATIQNPDVYPTSNETYVLAVTDANTCTDNDNVMITLNPLPIVSYLFTPNNGCAPHLVSFYKTSTNLSTSSCFWSFGDGTTSNSCDTTYNYLSAGNYLPSLTITTIEGCTNTLVSSDSVFVYQVPAINAGLDETICVGDSLTLTASNPDAGTLSWNNGVVDGIIFQPSTAGYYTVQSQSIQGCVGTDSLLVTINPIPTVDLGADITSCDAFVTLDGGAGMDSYTWSNTQTTQTIDATSSGLYWVTVTQNGCSATDSMDVLLLDCTSLIELDGNGISVYPNPANEIVYIKGIPENATVQLLDLNGKSLITTTSVNEQLSLDLSSFEKGSYLIQITIEEESRTLKFIKQ